MKYRVQADLSFTDESKSVALVNEVEVNKTEVFSPTGFTQVEIIRKAEKADYYDDFTDTKTNVSSVDFEASEVTHEVGATDTEYRVEVDVSFEVQQDAYDLLNYIETIKTDSSSDKTRSVRYFVCNHDEVPLIKDGAYTYVDFSIESQVHPIA